MARKKKDEDDKLINLKLAPLAPFKRAMSRVLDARGIKHTSKLRDVAEKFYYNVVKKGQHFESEHFVAAAVEVIIEVVHGIVTWFKDKKNAQDSGENLPSEEQAAVNQAQNDVNAAVTNAGSPEAAVLQSEHESGTNVFLIVFALVGIFVLYMILK